MRSELWRFELLLFAAYYSGLKYSVSQLENYIVSRGKGYPLQKSLMAWVLKAFNLAMFGKQAWKLVTPSYRSLE